MKNLNFRFFLSALALYSIMAAANSVTAAPVQFNQVVQIVNAKPGKAGTGGFAQLRLADDDLVLTSDDKKKNAAPPPTQDDRVITETRSEIVEEEVCDCENPLPPVIVPVFPYWTLGFAAAPLAFLIPPGDDETDQPPTEPTTPTPPMPPTEPIPEPMTIILFGTGLAGIGMAARRRFGKKNDEEIEA